MPQIRPLSDLQKFNEVSAFCHLHNEPMFFTKNGYGDLAVMSMETYNALLGEVEAITPTEENTPTNNVSTPYQYHDHHREELIDGVPFVLPRSLSTNESIVTGNIFAMFYRYTEGKSIDVFYETLPLVLSPKNRFFPDIFVISHDKVQEDNCQGAPELVVEVLDPFTAQNDRGIKKVIYQEAGVREYWLVDLSNHTLEVYYLQEGPYKGYIYFDPALDEDHKEEDAPTEFICNAFPDLIVHLEDVFARMCTFP